MSVFFLKKIEECQPNQIGNKVANLLRIKQSSNLLIPDSLILTTDFYSGVKDKLSSSNSDIRSVISNYDMDKIYNDIKSFFGDHPLVIRSSATCEDTPFISFAGQYSTILNIRGKENIRKAIYACLKSLSSENSIVYSSFSKINLKKESIAILIQKLVPVDIAGVIFTANPITGNKDEMVLEYCDGLGDKVVSGHRKPIYLTVNRTRKVKLEKIVQLVVKAALKVESIFGEPRDIEWGIKNDKVYIFQSRPITFGKKITKTSKIILAKKDKLIASAQCAALGVAQGRLKIIDILSDINSIKKKDIVYLRGTTDISFVRKIKNIVGIVTKGGILSHISVISREYSIPSLCNFQKNIEQYKNKTVIIDGTDRGLYTCKL